MADFTTTSYSTTIHTLDGSENGFIASTGTLYTTADDNVTITGGGNDLLNLGSIVNQSFNAIFGASLTATTEISNFGTISATSDAITLSGTGSVTVVNGGLIEGVGGADAIFTSGVALDLTNSGTIVSGAGFVLDLISGGAADITNSGEIVGQSRLSNNDDEVNNSGKITGELDLGGGDDVYFGTGIISGTVLGGNGNDTLEGGSNDDVFNGGADDDTLIGGGGEDELRGESGEDEINGGSGEDQIIGGLQRDLLTGGTGADVFIYEAQSDSATGQGNNDTIYDFKRGEDLIDLDELFVGDFTFIGTGSFTGGRQVRYTDQGDRSYIIVDSDGDGSGDMRIVVLNVTEWAAEDFIL